MTLRAAIPSDANAIAAILRDWIEATPYLTRLHTDAEDRRFIAHLIGTQDVLVHETSTLSGFIARHGGEITLLHLAAEARGKGLGTDMLNEMKARCAELTLWCFQKNMGARRFYERHGFVVQEMTDGQGNEEKVPDVRYAWSRKL